jgi:hypothetical protein
VLEFGGALSGEHGDGLVRGAFNEKMFGSELYQAFRQVKKTFDPNGLFNPGRSVDTPPITSHLRYGAGYATPSPATFFDFSDHAGFGSAAEMCSGVGLCRRSAKAMCPSHYGHAEEAHSTRGRANTLRLAMAGQLATRNCRTKASTGHGSLPRVPRLQERMPRRRRRRAIQERVSLRLLGSSRCLAHRSCVWQRAAQQFKATASRLCQHNRRTSESRDGQRKTGWD